MTPPSPDPKGQPSGVYCGECGEEIMRRPPGPGAADEMLQHDCPSPDPREGEVQVIYWQPHISPDAFLWDCPKCGAGNVGTLGPEPVGGWESPRWQLTGTREKPTLRPSLGCWACYPDGHYWCNEGVLTDA